MGDGEVPLRKADGATIEATSRTFRFPNVVAGVASLLLLFPVVLFGMSSKYGITVVRDGQSSISFLIEEGKKGGRVNTFLVVTRNDAGQWDYKHPVWSFELSPGDSTTLQRVTYGDVPDGYVETKKAEFLSPGRRYLAVGMAPSAGGSVEFLGP